MTAERLPGGEEMKYTEAIHAKRLLGMLNRKNPCLCCPKCRNYSSVSGNQYMPWQQEYEDDKDSCLICRDFLEITSDGNSYSGFCPCYVLGEQEAIKQTWLALEEKGYLD